MLTFKILSGKQAGCSWAARRFPVRIGRADASDLRLEDDGVWDEHARVRLQPREGFLIEADPNALLTINTHPVISAHLKNGDVIQLGGARLQFWLGPPRQRGLRFREYLIWAGIAAISFGQVALIYILLK